MSVAAEAARRTPGRAQGRVVSPRLVGRDAELGLLVETLTRAPAVAVVQGEAGIGKTRLLAELAARPEFTGRRWLTGGCRKVREPFPLGPMIEALLQLVADELHGARLSPVVGALRPLLPELAPWLPLAPEPLDDRAAERHHVVRGIAALLGALGPVVLVLDDLHWADTATVELLTYLVGQMPPGLVLVLAYRGEEAQPDVRTVTAKLPPEVRHTQVTVPPLTDDQTGALAAAILDTERVSTEFATHLCERASGVPLAVEELLALLQNRGTLARHGGRWERPTRPLNELDVPAGIRDPVLERVSRLSAAARQVVEAAAVLAQPVPLGLLTAVTRTPHAEALNGADEALASGLLTEHGGTIGWRHVLAAQAVYDALSGPRRTDLHGRAATALEHRDPAPLGQLAHHLRHAGRVNDWVNAAERAADQAIALGDDAEAVRLLEDVLREAPLPDDQRSRLAVKLGRAAHETLRSSPELVDLLTEVLDQQPPGKVRGELSFYTATAVQAAGGDPGQQRRLLTEAVTHLDDRPDLKAWAMVALGMVALSGIGWDEHKRWLQQALDILPDVGDPVFEVYLLGKIAMELVGAGDPAWRSVVLHIDDHTNQAPRHRREINAYYSVGMVACYAGHHHEAQRLLAHAREGAEAGEHRSLTLMVRSEMALLDCCRGAWDGLSGRVDALLDELADFPLGRVDVEVAAGILGLARGDTEAAQHRLTQVWPHLESLGEIYLLALTAGALTRMAGTPDDTQYVVTRVDQLLAAMDSTGLWAPLPRLLPAAVQLKIAAGQQPDARNLVSRCDRNLTGLDAPLAPAALRHAHGLLDTAEGRHARAAERCLAAADLYEQHKCPYEAAQAREHAGLALAAAGDAHAEEVVRAALGAYERLGASWDASRCTRLARSAGLRLPVTYRGGRKGYGQQLSPREAEIARLAAAGCTNKEISAKLFLSPSTVNKHLVRAMRKLGVHNRTALAGRLPDTSG